MYAYSTQADSVAIGNVLGVDIILLKYNVQGRVGTPEQRTQWNIFPVNNELFTHNVFSSRCVGEPLRILNEDDVHCTKLVWMPQNAAAQTICSNTLSTANSEQSNQSEQTCSIGSVTRKRSRESENETVLKVINGNTPVEFIVDNLVIIKRSKK